MMKGVWSSFLEELTSELSDKEWIGMSWAEMGGARFSKSKEKAQSKENHGVYAGLFKQLVFLESRAESWKGWMVVVSALLSNMNFILKILGSLGKWD